MYPLLNHSEGFLDGRRKILQSISIVLVNLVQMFVKNCC